MGFLSNLFSNKETELTPVLVDMHSHLLPGIDDGSQSISESLDLIKELVQLGYRKLITTPHVTSDFYKNNPDKIFSKLNDLKSAVKEHQITVEIEAAAEYYLDEMFLQSLKDDKKLLTFGDNYLLFETSYLNEPVQLAETIFQIKSSGYWPVLAHPERYQYLASDLKRYQEIYDLGVSFQLNINSISGYICKITLNPFYFILTLIHQ